MADNINTTGAATPPGVSDSDFAEAAANPSSFSVEGLSQTNRPLSELIAADKYLRKRNRAACRRHPLSGIGIAQMVPPGP
ncbi:MAG: hypothetical protein IKP97_00585 [Kiritimatiellae bacterium]|nr:hypothetical protein [Kiritimatiellia bacterium]